MRIEKKVFFEVLNALRNEIQISVNHKSFEKNKNESSHLVALLEKGSFIEIINKNPITIKSNKKWHSDSNENIWNYFIKIFPSGTEFFTPVQYKLNIIDKWKDDRIVYYPDKNLIKYINKEKFSDISGVELTKKLKNISETEKESIINSRIGQDVLRSLIIEAYNNSCAMCEINEPKLLRASHIIKWSEDEENRLNPKNVLCLCGLHDLAFENGIITINDNYEIQIHSNSNNVNSLLEKITYNSLNLPQNKNFYPDKDFLRIHRNQN